jgi:hypothetical protein
MAAPSTLSELLACMAVTSEQVDAAITAYLTNPMAGPCEIMGGIIIDIAAAVEAHGWVKGIVEDEALSDTVRRMAVRTAILLARAG